MTSWEDPPAGRSVLLAPGLVSLLVSQVKDSSGFGGKWGAKTRQPLGPRTDGELEGRGVGGRPCHCSLHVHRAPSLAVHCQCWAESLSL